MALKLHSIDPLIEGNPTRSPMRQARAMSVQGDREGSRAVGTYIGTNEKALKG
jgi:hypothetical protein